MGTMEEKMKYTIFLTKHTYGFIEIEANSIDEATEIAAEEAYYGDVHWTDSDAEVVGYEICEDDCDDEEDE
jgi:hypothetical protein